MNDSKTPEKQGFVRNSDEPSLPRERSQCCGPHEEYLRRASYEAKLLGPTFGPHAKGCAYVA